MSGFDKEYDQNSAHKHFELALRKLKSFDVNVESLDYYKMNQDKWNILIHQAVKNGATEEDLCVIRMMIDE